MSTLIVGATGRLGTLVIESLLAKGLDPTTIVATGRDRERLRSHSERGVRTMTVDLDHVDEIRDAFIDATRVLLISVPGSDRRVAQHGCVIDEARRVGVEQFVYTSWTHADISSIHADHRATERLLADTDLPHVMLRNPAYFEFRTSWIPVWRAEGRVLGATAHASASGATRADLAEAAAVVLTSDGHDGRTYELGGDEYTLDDFASELSAQTATTIPHVDVTVAEYEAHLRSVGLHDAVASHLARTDGAIAAGELSNTTGDLARLLGRPLTPLSSAIADALQRPVEDPVLPPVRSSD